MESKSNEDSTFDSFLYEDDEELNLSSFFFFFSFIKYYKLLNIKIIN